MQNRRPILIFLVIVMISLVAWRFEPLLAAAPLTTPVNPQPSAVVVDEKDQPDSASVQLTAAERKHFTQIRELLWMTSTGRTALELMDRYGVDLQFVTGGGSYFNPSNNGIVIDASHSPVRAALSFVHEMNHARYQHEDFNADILRDSRQEYVRRQVQEEAEGVVKSIEAKMELEEAGVDVDKLRYTLEYPYRKAYEAAVAAGTGNPDVTKDELKAIGRAAGMAVIVDGFMNGKTWTSNTKESYPDYYGAEWDRVNASS